jgi:hypothetical protein
MPQQLTLESLRPASCRIRLCRRATRMSPHHGSRLKGRTGDAVRHDRTAGVGRSASTRARLWWEVALKFAGHMADTGTVQALIALVIVGTAVWVGVDSSHRDWRSNGFANATWKWVIGMLLLWIVVFPVYLAQRGRVPLKA